jgi:hypothetical protein
MSNPHYVRWMAAKAQGGAIPADSPFWTPPPGVPGPGQVFPGSQQRCVILDHVGTVPSRRCIACGAVVRPGQSEACPHE